MQDPELLRLQWGVMTQGCSQTHEVKLFMHNERLRIALRP